MKIYAADRDFSEKLVVGLPFSMFHGHHHCRRGLPDASLPDSHSFSQVFPGLPFTRSDLKKSEPFPDECPDRITLI
jgi:hypothetical protein